jgi:predicted restriction endonuclease
VELAFDKGLISFADDGRVIVSQNLTAQTASLA